MDEAELGSNVGNTPDENPATIQTTRPLSAESEPARCDRNRNGSAVLPATIVNAAEHSSLFRNVVGAGSLRASILLQRFLLPPGDRSNRSSLPIIDFEANSLDLYITSRTVILRVVQISDHIQQFSGHSGRRVLQNRSEDFAMNMPV